MNRSAILLVEEVPSARLGLTDFLRGLGHEVVAAATPIEAAARFERSKPNVVVMNLRRDDSYCLDLVRQFVLSRPSTQVIVMSEDATPAHEAACRGAGANGFLAKPVRKRQLQDTIRRAIAALGTTKGTRARLTCRLIGSSEAIDRVRTAILRVSRSDVPVFLSGASGTGKSLAARIIHDLSGHDDQEFLAVNCATIKPKALDITLRNLNAKPSGNVTQPRTLFLDNLCDLEPASQASLLELIEGIQHDGRAGRRTIRLISASCRDPHKQIQEGNLRPDLFFRLNVVPIHLPPLRNRSRDVLEIAEAKLAEIVQSQTSSIIGLSDEVSELFLSLNWPGNVRELLNLIHSIAVLHDGASITTDMLPHHLLHNSGTEPSAEVPPSNCVNVPAWQGMTLAEIERDVIETTILREDGSVPRAARALQVSASTLYRKLETWAKSDRQK